jgi:RNA polymerase sigma-70 factor, ECF subfamily
MMLPINENDSQRLVEQARQEPQAFAALYDQYVERIYRYVARQTGGDAQLAQDITSATFEKALAHIQRYRWQGVSFCAWLYRIARNELVQQQRKQRLLAPLFGWYAGETHVEKAVQANEQHNELQEAMARLSAKEREVISLRFFEELSSAEAGEVLGCSTANVYLRLHRALGHLRQELERGHLRPQQGKVENYVPR